MSSTEEANEVFSLFMSYPSCTVVQTLPYEERCAFVENSVECQEEQQYVNYVEMLYCWLDPHSEVTQVLSVFVLMTVCLLMFVVLGVTADLVFCPALRVVSRMLGMNEHLAGVTLLAFGNGSPDVIATFADANDPERILLADLFGAAIYVIGLVGGMIFIWYPFKMEPNNILRDISFLMLGCIVVDYCMVSDGHVTILESVIILSIYIIYLIIIILDQFIVKFSLRVMEKRMMLPRYHTAKNLIKLEKLRIEATIEIVDHRSHASIDVHATRKSSYNALDDMNKDLFKQFKQSLNPIIEEEWNDNSFFFKIYCIVKTPIVFVILIFIPMVDFELERHGWSKLLNCIQIPLFPVVALFIMFPEWDFFGIPIPLYTLIITLPAATYVFLHTRTDISPTYHTALALYPVAGCMLLIHICATEAVYILFVLGIVTYSSTSFLGCTLQAWGNSIGDLVSTVSMARSGYPKMAIAACIGAPFFNSIVSMGGTFLYNSFRSDEGYEKSFQGSMCENCVIFLMITLFCVIVSSLVTNFESRKSVGMFNLILYTLFMVYCVLGESEVIETYAPEEGNLDAEALEQQEDD